MKNGQIYETGGAYAEGGHVYQALHELPNFNGARPVIGAWITGEQNPPSAGLPAHERGGRASGIGIREGGPITDNRSRFAPHFYM